MAKITGVRSGLPKANRGFTTTEPILSVEKLKDRYMFGIKIEDGDGELLKDETYQACIESAVSTLSHQLDISIYPIHGELEDHDVFLDVISTPTIFQLYNYPLISVEKIEMVLIRDDFGEPQSTWEIPQSWYRVSPRNGCVRILPLRSAPTSINMNVPIYGIFLPHVIPTRQIPHVWRVTYSHGFEAGLVPCALNDAIGLLASLNLLSIAGHLVINAGISAQSFSIDGLQQSIQTTSSATASGFSATRDEYYERLYGKREGDPAALITVLRNYYKGLIHSVV